jgi:hypothetical protein
MSELTDMSIEELKEQATILGVAFPNNITAPTLIKKIEAALDGSEQDDELEGEVKAPEAKPTNLKEKTWIIISEDPTDKQPAFVGVNGKHYRIKRGVPVEVPTHILFTLKAAKKQILDSETGEWRKIPTYSFHETDAPE